MSVIKIITHYKEVFDTEEKTYTYNEAIRLISACKSKGSDIQKASFLIHDTYLAMSKLFMLGLREPAVELAEHLLETSTWYQEFNIASEVCKKLINHYMVYADKESADKYSEMYKSYRRMSDSEHEVRQIFNQIIYNTDLGLPVDVDKVNENLSRIEKVLEYDSCTYHYFYYRCKIKVSEGYDKERSIEEGLTYFENAYFKHDSYIIIFLNLLIQHSINTGEISRAYNLLEEVRLKVTPGSKSWFDCIQSHVELLIKDGSRQRAAFLYEKAINHEVFKGFAELQQAEWTLLGDAIYSEQHQLTHKATS